MAKFESLEERYLTPEGMAWYEKCMAKLHVRLAQNATIAAENETWLTATPVEELSVENKAMVSREAADR